MVFFVGFDTSDEIGVMEKMNLDNMNLDKSISKISDIPKCLRNLCRNELQDEFSDIISNLPYVEKLENSNFEFFLKK